MSNADWYARKLRGEPAQPVREPLPPIPVAMPVPVQPAQFRPTMPSPAPAPSSTGCPSCGSANFGSPGRDIPPRCFDCGEGLAIQNSTQGMPAPNTGSATPAMQVQSAGYQPGTIVGRI